MINKENQSNTSVSKNKPSVFRQTSGTKKNSDSINSLLGNRAKVSSHLNTSA